jgi:hypothetical protein
VPEVVKLLSGAPGRWWLSGGHAIDEFLGYSSREHGDIDVTVAREDWPTLHTALSSVLDVWVARRGLLYSTRTTAVTAEDNHLWARWAEGGPWRLQLNLENISAGEWAYRRDKRITRSIAKASWWSGQMTCIAPAVQLLWKAADASPKDEHDYRLVVPRLARAERAWLGDAIRLAHPSSPWAARAELAGDADATPSFPGGPATPGR